MTETVVITGIGLVSSLGVGVARHREALSQWSSARPATDGTRFAPYTVHPLPEIDWNEQIPRKDQRQMDQWQRLGVFAAGLALDDAGLKDDAERCASMDMIVAAGGGERDVAVDTAIVDASANANDREAMLNEYLLRELRPTLFLSQLSNLMAGNISIVHKVTGSSRTFMGEEAAGITALEIAFQRLKAGQTTHALVGGAQVAERPDMLFVYETAQSLSQGDWTPIAERANQAGGGIVPGSVGVFLVLESLSHAQARGARIYAVLSEIGSARGARENGAFEERLGSLLKCDGEDVQPILFSGASGFIDPTVRELAALTAQFGQADIFTYSDLFGHALEAQMPLGVAVAAMTLSAGDASDAGSRALVSVVGYKRAEGVARLSAWEAQT
jgi:3-oxoacyl-[acyl-carrier-protein] synthase II